MDLLDADVAFEPVLTAHEVRDARLRRRFTAAFGSGADDAWAWLADPAAAGPSGAPSPAHRLRSARRPLYGRNADAARADYATVAAAVHAERSMARAALAAARGTAPRRPGRRLLVAAVSGCVALAVTAGLVSALAPAPQRHRIAAPPPLTSAVFPLPLDGAEHARIDALFAREAPRGAEGDANGELGGHLVRDAQQTAVTGGLLATGQRLAGAPNIEWTGGFADGAAQIDPPEVVDASVTATLIVVLTSSAQPWDAVVTRQTTAGGPLPSVHLHASASEGALQYAELFAEQGVRLTHVTISMRDRARFDAQVVLLLKFLGSRS